MLSIFVLLKEFYHHRKTPQERYIEPNLISFDKVLQLQVIF